MLVISKTSIHCVLELVLVLVYAVFFQQGYNDVMF